MGRQRALAGAALLLAGFASCAGLTSGAHAGPDSRSPDVRVSDVPPGAGTLEGRRVTFTVMTWDDPQSPYIDAKGRSVTVGEGVEFGLEPEGLTGGLDIVPVAVEILPSRIELSYPKGFGTFYQADFNGYVLRFDSDCALFERVAIDADFTTMAITAEDVFTEGSALYVNTSGRRYGPELRLALDLEVADCPID